jgi:UDP-perosamine 4-acetyltransferase
VAGDVARCRDPRTRRSGLVDVDARHSAPVSLPHPFSEANARPLHTLAGVAVDDPDEHLWASGGHLAGGGSGRGRRFRPHGVLGAVVARASRGCNGDEYGGEEAARQEGGPLGTETRQGIGYRIARDATIAAVASREQPIPIIGVGAGSHAKSVLEAIRSAGAFEVRAIVDDDSARDDDEILGVPVSSGEGSLERFHSEGVRHAFVGVGGTKECGPRQRVFERLREAGFELPQIVHRSASVSPWARIGIGAQILALAAVNADADIGDGVIVNSGAIIEHDCRIGAHAHVAPGAKVAGLVTVGEGTHVGIGAVVIEGVRIGTGALVAAGAVVVRDVEDGSRVAGIPARPLAPRGAAA